MPSFSHAPTLSVWVRLQRRELGLTQEQLARQVHLSRSALQKIELGTLRPSAQVVALLARELRIASADMPRFLELAQPTQRPSQQMSAPLAESLISNNAGSSNDAPFFGQTALLTKPLFGRDTAMRQISALLTKSAARLVTLVGPPGVGKTHLAIAAAAYLTGMATPVKTFDPPNAIFTEGACVVDLAQMQAPSEILPNVGRMLGLAPEDDVRAVTDRLRARNCLLVLDRFEHMLDGATIVSQLLANTANLRILVTSRVALRLSVEQVFPVTPLALPEAGEQLERWYDMHKYSALQLFEQIVRRRMPDFVLGRADVQDVIQVCRASGGLPLAIELMAAQWKPREH